MQYIRLVVFDFLNCINFCVVGDSDKSKPWSKYAANSTAYKQNHPELHKQEDNSLKEKKPKKKSKKLEILDKVCLNNCWLLSF